MLWGFFVCGVRVRMSRVVFVIGGARSGKSAFALGKASEISGSKAFIATAQAHDAEMEERIDKHRKERSSEWQTYEEPIHLAQAVRAVSRIHDVAVIDCLTLWVSNLLCGETNAKQAEVDFIEALRSMDTETCFIVVSNEVGMGIVPENELARRFRDMAGTLNQRVAKVADEVYLVAAGIPVKIK
jgi:adenosylcobinamide kinase/adenosylcobinamide-phosphate guanylyltransferase